MSRSTNSTPPTAWIRLPFLASANSFRSLSRVAPPRSPRRAPTRISLLPSTKAALNIWSSAATVFLRSRISSTPPSARLKRPTAFPLISSAWVISSLFPFLVAPAHRPPCQPRHLTVFQAVPLHRASALLVRAHTPSNLANIPAKSLVNMA